MVPMPIRPLLLVGTVALAGGAAALIASNGSPPPLSPSADRTTPPARSAAVPRAPAALSDRLVAADASLRQAIDAWRARGARAARAPPRVVTAQARYLERALRLLSRHPDLAAATIGRLPSRLAEETRQVTAAMGDLHRLSAGWPAHRVRIGPPDPLGDLLGDYRVAQRRFGVRWQLLAAVNFVESSFGRVRSKSVAGARGPMQFMPATWRVYGLGGDIGNPRDAILGAANLLSEAGAPAGEARALYAYNPSRLYVDAVRRYAWLIAHDRDAVYLLYSWEP